MDYLQNPLALGADIFSHSCTKFLGGHSDLISGALIVKDDDMANQFRYIQNAVVGDRAPRRLVTAPA